MVGNGERERQRIETVGAQTAGAKTGGGGREPRADRGFYTTCRRLLDMILSDVDVLRRLEEGDLRIEPLADRDLQIQPASVDLRLGTDFLEFQRTNIPCIHPNSEQEVGEYVTETEVEEGEEFVLHPNDFVLGTTIERVAIPDDLIAHVEGRSSLGRLAIVIHATAGLCDPGFRGKITLELSNLGTAPVALTPGMRVSQLTFTELSSPAERPYGPKRGSKYQDQSGPQASRIQGDSEFGGRQGRLDEHVDRSGTTDRSSTMDQSGTTNGSEADR